MQERDNISSYDAILDEKYGKVGTVERETFRKEASNYYTCLAIRDASKQEQMAQ